MHVATVVGTRPELIRLSPTIKLLDQLLCVRGKHTFIHTGQNWQPGMKDQFYKDLDLRRPDVQFEHTESTNLLTALEQLTANYTVLGIDRVLVLGDTHSAFAATLTAKKLGIPVIHVEAGNRCGIEMPEEINRRMIDHTADVHLCYTERARANLIAEGIPLRKTFVVGNPIIPLLNRHTDTDVLERLGLRHEVVQLRIPNIGERRPEPENVTLLDPYYLVTCHRAENVDVSERLSDMARAIQDLNESNRVILSVHPRLADRLSQRDIKLPASILHTPFNFSDFVTLEKHAKCVISDSGTVQEEASYLRTPCVVLREGTERPETVEHGDTILAGCSDYGSIINAVMWAATRDLKREGPPACYLTHLNPEHAIANITLGVLP